MHGQRAEAVKPVLFSFLCSPLVPITVLPHMGALSASSTITLWVLYSARSGAADWLLQGRVVWRVHLPAEPSQWSSRIHVEEH